MTIPSQPSMDAASREDPTTTEEARQGHSSTPGGDSLDGFVVTADDLDNDQEDEPEGALSLRDPKSLTSYERKILAWQNSAFAVGRVNATWQDDQSSWFRRGGGGANGGNFDQNPKVCCSAYVCGCLGAERVGNLAVLARTMHEYEHVEIVNAETGEQRRSRRKRPKLLWVFGPYWYINFCLTYPLIIGISLLTFFRSIADAPLLVLITWSACTILMIFSLIMAGCRDPGVLYRHPQPPPDSEGWTWNDQAKTYRPPTARFDPECQAVVEGFDHTYVFFLVFTSVQ